MRLSDRHSLLNAETGPVTAVAACNATAEERRLARSKYEPQRILRSLGVEASTGDRHHLAAIAALLADTAADGSTTTLLERLAAAVEAGVLLFIPGWTWFAGPRAESAGVRQTPQARPPVLRVSGPKKAVFELIIVDGASGQPLREVPLDVSAPDGSTRRVCTDSTGTVRIPDLDPGACSVTSVVGEARVAGSYFVAEAAPPPPNGTARNQRPASAPAHVVDVGRHRIRTGQTPASISKEWGVSWEDIAFFNWGTTVPDQLERHYRESLGCTRKTRDGQRLRFDDRDEPGLVLIPRPWHSSFSVGPVHRIFVSPLRAVFLALANEVGLAIPAARYEAHFADGTERRGVLGRSGIARLEGVPEGSFSVSYPDELDLLAKSLAVSVRKAFDQQSTAPLFTLLMQEQEVVDRAVAAYHEHLDDLTGAGLVADIDQVVTDPDARQPLLALCAMAGLAVEGAARVRTETVG